ncbi:predicted protein [Verticillium alfalfae VaMs.102]|uniref:Predicted protein n=1 Tax=Verticillium alfalfae (strain VaMs.102 / ATCC MYA-4576 / FGSC 10136) TaxID=526221 RepID=C9SMK7_VERA1|nr:predicted protein [Verticillium alfalfae VaMs.102]EEY20022.1 predicted protein [Verticillium alfalfae VaMs.102]
MFLGQARPQGSSGGAAGKGYKAMAHFPLGEDGPGVVADAGAGGGLADARQADAGLDGEAREGEDDAGEDVDDNLLVNAGDAAGAGAAAAEDEVAAEGAGEERVVGALLARRRAVVLEEEHGELVDGGELGEVAGRGVRVARNTRPGLLAEGPERKRKIMAVRRHTDV